MKSEFATWTAITVAFAFGLVGASVLAGCRQPDAPMPTTGSDDPVTIGEPEAVAPTEESPAEETPAEETPAEETPAETPEAKPQEEPAAPTEEKPEVEPTAPAEEKPEAEPTAPAEEKPAAEKPAEEPAPTEEKPAPEAKPEAAKPEAAKETPAPADQAAASPVDKSANGDIKPGDWSQWGGTSYRNNTPIGKNIPIEWEVGRFDRKTNAWISEDAINIKWVAPVGSQTYGNPVVADGQVYVGTNNGAGHVKRYPSDVDLGCLLCFDEKTGEFLWQHSSEKLPTGRVHDWPLQGICCAPYVEGDRVWFVTSRGEVRCLDAKGYHDGEDDGDVKAEWGRLFDVVSTPASKEQINVLVSTMKLSDDFRAKFKAAGAELPEAVEMKKAEDGKSLTFSADGRDFKIQLIGKPNEPSKVSFFRQITLADKDEADVIWVFNMMQELGVSQHNMCSCSVTVMGDILFVNTSNGLDESHINLPAPAAPSFIAMNKKTGEVYWTDASPGANILHGQWSSPTVAELGGVPQVIFAGGDGWVYSFRADKGNDGKPELLWKFDANPKESKWILGGRGTRNNIIATPVVYDGLVYVAVGQDPEHGEGVGHLWCLNPHKRGDVSPQLAVNISDRSKTIPHKRLQAVIAEEGEVAIDNENSAVLWHYSQFDQNGDGEFDFEEEMHRSCGTVAIKNDVLYIADFSGLFHCLNAKTGKVYWTYDMLAAAWGSPLIVDNHVYIGDEDGDVSVFDSHGTEALDKIAGELRELKVNLAKLENQLDEEEDEAKQEKLEGEIEKIEDAIDEIMPKIEPIAEINMGNSVYSTPIVANDVLYIVNKTHLFAITPQEAKKDGAE